MNMVKVEKVLRSKLEERCSDIHGSRIIRLPKMRIGYTCDVYKIPILLDPIKPSEIHNFRHQFFRDAMSRRGRIQQSSFADSEKRYDHDRDIVIDMIQIKSEELKPGYMRFDFVIGYAACPSDRFLSEFAQRYAELELMENTWDVYNFFIGLEIDSLVDQYLNGMNTSLDGLVVLADNDKYLEFCRDNFIDDDVKKRLLRDALRDHIGILASMNRDLGTSPEEYFSNLRNATIYPLKDIDDNPIFDLVEESFLKGIN